MNFSRLDAFMEQMPARGFPSSEIAVTYKGDMVFRKSVGYSDSARTVPTSDKDIYWIFSASKVITCIAAMTLVEEGRISIDDPVCKYIPEFANMSILNKDGTLCPATEQMKIVHLFTMSGGMTYDIKTKNILEAEDRSTLGIVRAMAKDPLMFEPGTRYRYSLCHDVLAAVVEVVSGMRFSEYLEKKIFVPLDIKDMGFRPSEEQKSRFSAMYRFRNGECAADEIPLQNAYILSPEYDSGGAGLFSTVDEYIKIITAVACGGTAKNGYRLLKPETVQMIGEKNRLCPKALNDFATTRFYGYGWGLCGRVHINPLTSFSRSPVGEFGWDGAAGAFSMVDAKNEVALYFATHIFGCNYVYQEIHPRLRNLVYECLEQK